MARRRSASRSRWLTLGSGSLANIGLAVVPAPGELGSRRRAWRCIRTPIELLVRNAELRNYFTYTTTMRWLFSFLLFGILGVVRAVSYSGNRLLVVLEEESEREKYAVFLGDLSGKFWTFFTRNWRPQERLGRGLKSWERFLVTVDHFDTQATIFCSRVRATVRLPESQQWPNASAAHTNSEM
jgi:hypothetical protein